jgi:hypothetical protein
LIWHQCHLVVQILMLRVKYRWRASLLRLYAPPLGHVLLTSEISGWAHSNASQFSTCFPSFSTVEQPLSWRTTTQHCSVCIQFYLAFQLFTISTI